ncbi:MAG: glutaminase [Oscillospiraceae bacterium]
MTSGLPGCWALSAAWPPTRRSTWTRRSITPKRPPAPKNRALAYLLKAHGLIRGDVEELLDCYFRACSIRVSAADLARIGCVLACHGQLPDGQRLFPAAYGRFVNANLMTCGMYDGSGDFAIRVGVPAKSGVGGGIMAVVPGRMGVGLFSPALDEKGNSLAGIRALELLSARLDLSVF